MYHICFEFLRKALITWSMQDLETNTQKYEMNFSYRYRHVSTVTPNLVFQQKYNYIKAQKNI